MQQSNTENYISRKIRENGKDFPDRAHIIYVDSKNQEDTELGRLMHDFHCKSPEEMYHSVLQKQVFRLKKTREGVNFMCREMDKIYSCLLYTSPSPRDS